MNLSLIDGASGSELERRGVDTSLPLWSARALLDAPEILARIHREYLEAGAEAITTNTFRTHQRSLAKAGLGDRAGELTRSAVEIAQRVRDEISPAALVLGSVSPLEDCYEPGLAPPADECAREHEEMIGHLVEAGVDLLLIETMNNLKEAKAAIDEARRGLPGRWIASFCMRSHGPPGALLSGERIDALVPSLADSYAIGINCVSAPEMEAKVAHLRAIAPQSVRIIAYANVGQADPVRGWVNTDAVAPERYAMYAQRWLNAGATIIGGCCGTTPATIAAIKNLVRSPDAPRGTPT
jgi:S-methylmethionine-dependent homocysteine/selenocysteine methylase